MMASCNSASQPEEFINCDVQLEHVRSFVHEATEHTTEKADSGIKRLDRGRGLLEQNQKRTDHATVRSDRGRNCNNGNPTPPTEGDISFVSSLTSIFSSNSELLYGSQSVINLFVPITLCMSVVVMTINAVTFFTEGDVYLVYTPFHEKTDDPVVKIGESIANALILLCIIICATLLLLCLYIYEFYKVLQCWMLFTTFLMLFFFAFLYLQELLKAYNVPLDYITALLLLWNFGVIGMMCIHWRGPLLVQQMYMIAISALVSLMFIKHLPDWTTWTVLIIVAIWDLIAVLCPMGPLKMLVETAHERDQQIFPALIYSSTMLWNAIMADAPGEKTVVTRPSPVVISEAQSVSGSAITGIPALTLQPPTQPLDATVIEYEKRKAQARRKSYEKGDGVQLGLGDFIFYSMLVGKASAHGDWNTTLACFVAILIGLAITLLMLIVVKKALPALPVSICFGIIFYFCTSIFVKPFMDQCSFNQVFI
ncbi:Presenilin-1 [Lamellibrachia satsuma]|nr:Presenilin-1 [Lamellibrachia satsuma]